MGPAYMIKKTIIVPAYNHFVDVADFDYEEEDIGVVYSLEQAVAACDRLNDTFDITTDEHCSWIYDEEYECLLDLLEEEEFHDPYHYEKYEYLFDVLGGAE